MLAAAVALGVAELAAGITGPQGAPVIAVGEVAINLTPIPVKEFAIAHFGSHDKEALVAGIVVLLVAFAALVGILAVRRIAAGLAGLAAFAAVGAAAAVSRPTVEVSVDGGPWHAARLAAADGIDTWRQWMWPWDATPGLHRLQVRATDRAGTTQPARRAPSFPNGASGWDSVVVTVT